MADTHRRVKLYALNAERQWDDRGTGHVSSTYVDRLKGMSLQVRAESDGSILLESKIQADTAYQKQQETLIVWSEGDHYDLALSFQEKAGCDEIWAKICQVQGKDPSVEITQDVAEDEEDRFDDSTPDIDLPPCEADSLDSILELIQSCLPYPLKREKLTTSLEKEDYIPKLLQLFRTLESSQNMKALHKMYDILKNIFLLNQNSLYEIMLSEDALFDVLGVFEYDPNTATPKRHRDYLKSVSRFKEVIPFGNQKLINKIHQTYRTTYIQDVILPTPSVFEDNVLSTLSSIIFFNKVEIVSMIQEDDKFLRTLFSQIKDQSTASSRRKDLVLFLKEFCTFSQTLQPQSRDSFFKALASLGVLQALEVILADQDLIVKSAAVDILTYVVEFSPSMVREYALKQEQSIVKVVIDQMISDPDPDLGMAVQLSSILRLLLDPENMLAAAHINKTEKADFLNFFYKHCMNCLVAPVFDNTLDDKPQAEDSRTAQLLSLILELLSFCVEHHSYHTRTYVIQRDLLRRILVLMKSKHTFLVLSSLRFFRKIIGLKDDFYNRHIVNSNLFAPIVEALQANNGRYNLLDSAIIELFEFIRTEEIRSLCVHIIDKFGKQLEKFDYVRTFKGLKHQFEQHNDRLRDTINSNTPPHVLHNNKYRRDPREMDEEEECWFDREDEEVDDIDPTIDDCYKFETNFPDDLPSKKLADRKSITAAMGYSTIESVKTTNVNRNTSNNTRKSPVSPSHTNSPTANSDSVGTNN